MKKPTLLLFMIMTFYIANAQKECSKTMRKYLTLTTTNSSKFDLGENEHPYGGTFQFIISKNAVIKEVFTTEILKVIENNRYENKENILVLSPNTKVKILSKNQINQPDFHPIIKLYTIE